MLDLLEASIADLQAVLCAGDFTSVDLVKAYIARIEEVNDEVRAVLCVSPVAIEDAAKLDEERKAGSLRSNSLHGIPVLIKDNISTRYQDGMDTTAGSLALKGVKVDDAHIVTLLRDAGAIILGKLNMSEWAYYRHGSTAKEDDPDYGSPGFNDNKLPSGWSPIGGQTTSAFFKDGEPMGSSSGSGPATVLGLAAATLGSETNGSIISPSNISNIVGLRPTVGLVSRRGMVPVSPEHDSAGPMTRTVADSATLLTVLAGQDAGDPCTLSQPTGLTDYAALLKVDALAGKRIGIPRNLLRKWGSEEWENEIYAPKEYAKAAFAEAVAVIQKLGADVIEVDIDRHEVLEDDPTYDLVMACEFKSAINEYLAKLEGCAVRSLTDLINFTSETPEETPATYEGYAELIKADRTGGLGDPAYAEAKANVDQAKRVIDASLAVNRLDAFILPTCMTSGWSQAGYPQITVPLGFAPADCVPRKVQNHTHQTYWNFPGQPFGLTFAGTAYSEARLLAFAFAFEQATHHRKRGKPYKEATPTAEVCKISLH